MRKFFTELAIVASVTALFFGVAAGRERQESSRLNGFSPARAEGERQLEQRFRAIPDSAHAESDLRRLTSEPHMAGTEASRRIAEWLRDQYRSFGFNAEIATYKAWMPQPREVRLELVAPVIKPLATPEKPFDGDKDTLDPHIAPAFNAYSPSADVTAPVVYVNYGMPEDYRSLDSMGVSVEGKIVLARYGRGYRGIKTKVAEEHQAAGVIVYSDPDDDGFAAGDPYPNGPWRPMSGIQRGSVMYTQIYPGDPLTPGVSSLATGYGSATAVSKRLAPSDAQNLPHIPTIPINAQDAQAILSTLEGPVVPHGWQGALPVTYHVGMGATKVHLKVAIDYAERSLYDVIATLPGENTHEWVMLGNHHDAWVFGAADPGSGTVAMLEVARSLGELARTGWKPARSIVMASWDGEEFGLIGSTEWVEANRAELQAHAAVYINTDVGATGPNFAASASPSLGGLIRDVAHEVEDPATHGSVYDAWREHARTREPEAGTARQAPSATSSGEPPVGALGAGSDFCPFLDHVGVPAIDVGFGGDYGVYHSMYDDFFWMKHFGDPNFAYQVTLAKVIGTLALRFAQADLLPFDYSAYAAEISHMADDLSGETHTEADAASLKLVSDAAADLSASAARAQETLRAISAGAVEPGTKERINRALDGVEQDFLTPNGLVGRPWFKHTIYAPGSYAGYAAEIMPGVTEALAKGDSAVLRQESNAVAAALSRASARLVEISRLAQNSGADLGAH